MERQADYLKYYQIARDECAEMIANRNQHTLNPNYENIWRNVTSFTYDPQGEIIFEVGAGGGNGNSDSRMGNYDGPNLNNASRYGAGGGGIIMLPNYYYAFDSVDTRRDITITHYAVNGANNVKSQRRLGELNTGKYRRDWRVPLLPGTVLNVGYNWSMIRFADVLLMYAEAVNEINNGPTAQATAAFEEVRRRAYAGNTGLIGVTPTDKAGFFIFEILCPLIFFILLTFLELLLSQLSLHSYSLLLTQQVLYLFLYLYQLRLVATSATVV
jgi:hypothetical protein